MGTDAAGLRETKRVAIGDYDRSSDLTRGHGSAIDYSASQLPGS
jgi:hypothetical protein